MKAVSVMLLTVGALLVAGSVIVVGYSYSGATENTDNTSTLEYVILEQDEEHYTFGTGSFNLISIVMSDNHSLKAAYCIQKSSDDVDSLCSIGTIPYYGVQIGDSSKLKGTYSLSHVGEEGYVRMNMPVLVTNGSGSTYFADLSGSDWRYIIEVSYNNEQEFTLDEVSTTIYNQYAVLTGAGSTYITHQSDGSYVEVTEANGGCLTLIEGVEYTTKLYLAGPGYDMPLFGGYHKKVIAATIYLANPPPKQNDLTQLANNNGYLLKDGVISFIFDSSKIVINSNENENQE